MNFMRAAALILLALFLCSSIAAKETDFGFNLMGGFSFGTGTQYDKFLEAMGGEEFGAGQLTGSAGIFLEQDISTFFALRPELYYTVNRGIRAQDDYDNHIAQYISKAIEMQVLLMLGPQREITKEGVSVFAGPQVLYSLGLEEDVELAGEEATSSMDNLQKLSYGVVFGAAYEKPSKHYPFKYLFDIRAVYPLSDTFGLETLSGSDIYYKTCEVLFSFGLKF